MQGHELFDPWAEHPVVNKNICFGGGGTQQFNQVTPSVPDYTKYISAMTNIGNQGQGWATDLNNWAQQQGLNLGQIAQTVSGAAGGAATGQQQTSDQLMQQWQGLSQPLYAAQQADTMRMIGDLPGYQEQQAGKAGADAAAAVDASKASAVRAMEARGLAPNAAATGALDTAAGTQRAMATTAAAETARTAARNEARAATTGTLTSEQAIPNVASTVGALATQNRTQQASVPMQAASTSAGLYQPAMGMYSAAYPYMAQWGQTMGQSYNENLGNYNAQLQAFGANQQAAQNAGNNNWLAGLGGMAGGLAGSYLGPMGAAMGSKLGSSLGSAAGGNTSGTGSGFNWARGGAIDTVPPTASPSGGRRTDDVHAALSVGEFVMPKRTVDWYGDKFFHNLINKADKDQGKPPEPIGGEPGPNAAIMTQPPMFRSEGAR
jgi:hypothetical protein